MRRPPSRRASIGLALEFRVHVLGGDEGFADAQELRARLAAEDARVAGAGDAGEGAALQRAIDVDRAAGDDLRAGGDAAEHDDVAFEMHDLLAGAQVAVVIERLRARRRRRRGRRLRRRRLGAAGAAAAAGSSNSLSALTTRPPATTGGRCGPTSSLWEFSTAMTRMCRRASWPSRSRYSFSAISSAAHLQDDRLAGEEIRRADEPFVERVRAIRPAAPSAPARTRAANARRFALRKFARLARS